MSDAESRFHEQWLGMVQPIEGLVVSVPTLVDAQCWKRLPLETRDLLLTHCHELDGDPGEETRLAVDLEGLLFDQDLLAFKPEDFDRGEDLPEDLKLWVPEGRQEIVPTLALRRKRALEVDENATPAQRAGAGYQLLIWRLPDGLDLDRPEAETGPWEYPPTAKFDRLLRHCRIAAGVVSNGCALRLLYAPHGESSGWLTFRVADYATVGGRSILDALVMLLGRASFFGRAPEARLEAILADSRKRQANVTEELAKQVFRALEILLAGFEAAAERDGTDGLEDARRLGIDGSSADGEHLYGGLLTVLLRLVFLLYAEDRDPQPDGAEERLDGPSLRRLGSPAGPRRGSRSTRCCATWSVDLAKLSLWLETLARDLPFTFLDHALRWGDSLVGLDFDQIRGFHWKPEAQQTLASEALDEALSEAIALRQEILDLAGEGPEAEREKERLLRDADDALGHARLVGDLVVGAFFAHGKDKARRQELAERLTKVNTWLESDGGAPPDDLIEMQLRIRQRVPVFHWMLEFPEMFYAERPDPLDGGQVNGAAYIDAFVGNPPFVGGRRISTNFGDKYSDWLVHSHAAGRTVISARTSSAALTRCSVITARSGSSPPTPSPKEIPARRDYSH